MKPRTLGEVARSGEAASRGAAALIEAGFAETMRLDELKPGSVTRRLAETFARELEEVYERLDETYESAFVETATGSSVELLIDGLCPRPWWRRLFRRS